jgi:hypothetical protein
MGFKQFALSLPKEFFWQEKTAQPYGYAVSISDRLQ